MLYQKSLDIEQRLQTVLRLIGTGKYSTAELAEEVGVSIPTISRDVTALRQRGHQILATRTDKTWSFHLIRSANENQKPRKQSKPR